MSEPIRVLHIVTTMNRGGLETMIMNYYRNIDRSKVQFDFLVHRNQESDYDQEILSLGGKIYRISHLNPFSFKYRKELKQFFKNHSEYKIVHCHLDCMSSIPLSYAKKAGIGVRIAHSHNANQEHNLKYVLKWYYKKKIQKYATILFACSKKAGKWMFEDHDFQILNNAIDAKKFSYNESLRVEMRKKLNLEDNFVIGHVGRFNAQKNHGFIIEVFSELIKINRNAKLLLVGEGDLENKLKKQVNYLGLDEQVIFYGKCDDVPSIMQVMDVFFFPSLFEGLPLTLIEAQASGLPCVISDIITNECCITHDINLCSLKSSIQNWVRMLNQYSTNFKRKNTYEFIVKRGFDIENNTAILEEVYCNDTK